MPRTRLTWHGNRRGMVHRLLATLTSLVAGDQREQTRAAADEDYTPLLFVQSLELKNAVDLLSAQCEADLVAKS